MFLTTYPSADASSRRRVFAVADELRARGYEVSIDVLLSERLYAIKNVQGLRASALKLLRLLAGLTRRLLSLVRMNARVVVIHREAFPFFTPRVERFVRRRCRALILDMDDGVFLHPGHGRDWRRRLRRPEGIIDVCNMADHLVVASPTLQSELARRSSTAITVCPTSPDLVEGEVVTKPDSRTILWIGSASTLSNLLSIYDSVVDALPRLRAEMEVIGAANVLQLVPHPYVHTSVWSRSVQATALSGGGVGLMPLNADLWDQYKGSYKALLYLAHGLPVVVSPYGMNADLARRWPEMVKVATTNDEWVSQIAAFVETEPPSAEVRINVAAEVRAFASPVLSADVIEKVSRATS